MAALVSIRGRQARRELAAERRGPAPPEVQRRTRMLGGVAGSTVVVLFGAELAHVWRLGTLPISRGEEASYGRRGARRTLMTLREGYRVSSTRDNLVFNMITSFAVTFGGARLITHRIRQRGRLGPIKNITAGGRHIHHFIPGMVIAFASGGVAIVSPNTERDRWLAIPFGAGLGLVLDETALLLELEDVYWSEKGVLSVQVVFAAMGLLAALAYAVQVRTRGQAVLEQDWEQAARAFDDLQMLRGGRTGTGEG